MGEFEAYFKFGLDHITDPKAYDHIVFIIALCAIYSLRQWRRVAVLVTAFTIGHSITLALAATNIIKVPTDFIEFLIPVTIILTAIYNVVSKDIEQGDKWLWGKYGLALFFGLIHGMGFSNYLSMLLGQEESIIKPLFAFNVGIEAGQLLIMLVILVVSYVFLNLLKVKQWSWNLFVSGMAAGIALVLMMETDFWQNL